MNTKQLLRGLGWFSIGLGLTRLVAPKQVARWIGLRDDHDRLLRGLGARELAAGVSLLAQPQEGGWLWSRVAGNLMDLGLLGAALTSSRDDRKKLSVATAIVAAVTAVDVYASLQSSRPPKAPPSWRNTPAGGLAGITRESRGAAIGLRTSAELTDRPLVPASERERGA